MLRLKQVEQAKAAIVSAAGDTQKVVLAALGIAVLALVVAVAAIIMCVKARPA